MKSWKRSLRQARLRPSLSARTCKLCCRSRRPRRRSPRATDSTETESAAETVDSGELNFLGKPYGSYDPSYRLRHSPPSIERLYKPFRSEVKAACFARVKLDGKGETKTGNGQEDFAWGATEAEDSTEAATA